VNFVAADSWSLSLFVLFSIFMYGAVLFAFKKANVSKKVPLIFSGFLVIFSIVVATGLIREHIITTVPILFVLILGFTICGALTGTGALISRAFSLKALIGFQSFRLLLELILHHWAEIGTVPVTMTWSGQNFDIVSGIACLIAIPFVNKLRSFAWVTQFLGIVLLLNVLRVVVMSSPLPFAWPLDNPLQLVMYFPYALIAPLFVAPAFFVHIVTLRKLLRRDL
jgi:hypothetical protein